MASSQTWQISGSWQVVAPVESSPVVAADARLTTLDEPLAQKLQSHLYVRSVAPWETLPDDGAERYETRRG